MGVCEGCTHREFLQTEASIGLDFEPKGTKKTLSEMLDRRVFNDPENRKIGQEKLDKMVRKRAMLIDLDKNKYVFSKDSEARYSWQPATRLDIIRYYFRKPLF